MSIVLTDPYYYNIIDCKESNEIREIFYQHWEKMKNQMKVVIDRISVWRSRNIQNINLYADEQLCTLQLDYNQQRGIFDKKRDENIDLAKAYHQSKQTVLFNELRTACQSLEFQVAQLEYVRHEIERPIVITVKEQRRRKKQTKISTHAHGFENPNQELIMTLSSNVNDQSASNNNNLIACTTIDDDSINKCPICFMIFPLNMTLNARHQHVEEHMTDSHDVYNTTV